MTSLHIHIGLRKTGSSALQELLLQERGLLAELGIDYPEPLSGLPAHQELSWCLMDPQPSYACQEFSREIVYDHYCQLIDANIAENKKTLLSSEDLSLLVLDFSCVNYVRERFEKYNPKIVFFEREPISYHVSNYKHMITWSRQSTSFSDYIFSFDALIDANAWLHEKVWGDAFGVDRVLKLQYDEQVLERTSILVTFLRDVFGETVEDKYLAHRSNVSLSNAAIKYILELNCSELTDDTVNAIKGIMIENVLPSNWREFASSNLSEDELATLHKIYKSEK